LLLAVLTQTTIVNILNGEEELQKQVDTQVDNEYRAKELDSIFYTFYSNSLRAKTTPKREIVNRITNIEP
jgi:hypothetical protein